MFDSHLKQLADDGSIRVHIHVKEDETGNIFLQKA